MLTMATSLPDQMGSPLEFSGSADPDSGGPLCEVGIALTCRLPEVPSTAPIFAQKMRHLCRAEPTSVDRPASAPRSVDET
jgi:hypothetical protein